MFIIVSISDSDKHWNTIIEEYTKRLWKSVKIENILPSKKGTIEQIIQADTNNIIAKLAKFSGYKKILLSKEGKQLTTMDLYKQYIHTDTVFIIGGPYWLDEKELEKYIDGKIAFGAITLPHGLVKVMVLEQLYRISTIEKGKKYHY